MDQIISAADANRAFSKLLRDVRQGQSYTVTSHGEPVARVIPYTSADDAKVAAREALWRRIDAQPTFDAEPWTRDELYER